MKYLDFLSLSPNLYIFQKSSNKTKFGGALFLIYIVLSMLIALYYIIYYIKNDKYQIEYASIINFYNLNEIAELNKNDKINPEYEIGIQIELDEDYKKLKIYKGLELIERGQDYLEPTSIKGRISDLHFFIIYECDNELCKDEKSILHINKEYKVTLFYDHYSYNFQSKNVLKKIQNIRHPINFYFNNYTIISNNWVNVFFKERKGLWQKEHIETYGSFHHDYTRIKGNDIHFNKETGKWYKILLQYKINNNHKESIEYKRKKVSIITVFANILSYFSNLFFIMKLINKYYSSNFDNYKIIEHIYKNKINNKMTLGLNEEEDKKINISPHNNEINLNLLTSNISKKEEKEEEDENEEINTFLNKNIKKLSFVDFFINNVYCKCCSKINKQEIINVCNNIIIKYCSIESILYRQILVDNLIKDYRWNNKDLSSINNNEYFIKLKNLLS